MKNNPAAWFSIALPKSVGKRCLVFLGVKLMQGRKAHKSPAFRRGF